MIKRLFAIWIVITGFLFSFSVYPPQNAFAAASYPSGFQETTVASGLNVPTAMTFAPDGRLFVSEKGGSLRIIKNGQLLSTPFVTVSVDTYRERGLMGIAFDPDFSVNKYVYVYYTRSSPTIKNRLSRFTADTNNPNVAEAGSEVIILDDIPADSGIHNAGAVHFGADGKLYLSVGDGGNSVQAQSLSSLSGKILRLNKNGSIPSDNPFTDQPGKRGEIWALGLRNPFTFAFKPGTNTMFINDVGQDTWEEINVGAKGANYGWPTCEGTCNTAGFTNPIYQQYHPLAIAITGAAFYTSSQFPASYNGVYFFGDYVKNYIKILDPSNNNVVSDFGSGTSSPVDIQVGTDGSLYYLSINDGTVYKVSYGTAPIPTPSVGSGNGLSATYFNNTDFTQAVLTRTDPTINFDWGGNSPEKNISPDRFSVRWIGQVQPQYSQTYMFYTKTDDGVKLWVNDKLIIDNWNDQSVTEKSGTITLIAGQKYNIKMEYYENYGYAIAQLSWSSPSTQKQIIPQSQLYASTNQPPTGTISNPVNETHYNAGDTINYAGTGTDPEDGTLPASAFSWNIVFHHDTHTHPFLGPIKGQKNGSFQIPKTGESSANVWYRIHLTVTDSQGATHTSYVDVKPNVSTINLATSPSGLQVTLDGQPKTTPYNTSSIVGFTRTLSAPSTQTLSGKTYQFVSWSDGGTQTHSINTPSSNTTFTATYKEVSNAGDGLLGTYFDEIDFTNQKLQRIDPTVDFDWGLGSPDQSIYQETFSVRWTGFVLPQYSEDYTFYTRTDDGVKLWVNGQLIIDNLIDQSATEKSGTIHLNAGQKYTIRMDYFDNHVFAVAQLYWSSPSTQKRIIPQSQLFSNNSASNGLLATYFDEKNLTGPSVSRIDPTVNFDWQQGSPDPSISPDTFSARWVSQIQPQFSETYTFYLTSDDGARLWVNRQLIIDNWNDQSATEKSGNISLTAGQKYDIKLEYYDNYLDSMVKLSWSSPSTPKQIVPESALFLY